MTAHLFPPLRNRKPRPRQLRRPLADGPRCENMRGHRDTPATQCSHKGRQYRINRFLTMTLCICCAHRLIARSGVTLRLVREPR